MLETGRVVTCLSSYFSKLLVAVAEFRVINFSRDEMPIAKYWIVEKLEAFPTQEAFRRWALGETGPRQTHGSFRAGRGAI